MEFVARIWRAAFRQGNLRLWSIVLGAPPLCGMVCWIIDLLAKMAVADDPVRTEIALAIADLGKLIILIIAVIVVALATVTVRASVPMGSIAIGGPDDDLGRDAPPPRIDSRRGRDRRGEDRRPGPGELPRHERIER